MPQSTISADAEHLFPFVTVNSDLPMTMTFKHGLHR